MGMWQGWVVERKQRTRRKKEYATGTNKRRMGRRRDGNLDRWMVGRKQRGEGGRNNGTAAKVEEISLYNRRTVRKDRKNGRGRKLTRRKSGKVEQFGLYNRINARGEGPKESERGGRNKWIA